MLKLTRRLRAPSRGEIFFSLLLLRPARSDRLYQPLFEANVLKFLVGFVLRGAALRFHVHMETFEGADVAGAYEAASLYSLMLGGGFSKAVDHLYRVVGPQAAAQEILDTLPSFAI
nr:Cfr10I/Bse634I family restriction endonuclease [Bradyrhizobium diazoefficiens]